MLSLKEKNKMIELELQAKFDNFIKLRENIFYFLESNNVKSSIISEILIVAEEIFTNIIRHSYEGESSDFIFVKISIEDDTFILRFMDSGKQVESINIPDSLSQIKGKVGGLGLYLIKKLSDSYIYLSDGKWNINEVKKKIN